MNTSVWIVEWVLSTAGSLAVATAIVGAAGLRWFVGSVATLVFVWMLIVAGSTFIVGVAGTLGGKSLALLGLAQILFVLGFWRESFFGGVLVLRKGCEEAVRCMRRRPVFACGLVLVGLVFVVRGLVHAWVLPPYVWDVMTYHLPKVGDWIRDGGLTMLDTPVARSFWPANMELIQAWCMVFPRHDAFVELAGLPWYALGGVAVFGMTRLLGCTRAWAAFSAIMFLSTPCLLMHAVSCKNDIVVSAIYLFVVALILRCWRQPAEASVWMWVGVASLLFGMGVKATMVFLVPGLVVLAGFALLVTSGARPLVTAAPGRPVGWAVGLMTAAVVLGGYWYVRNWAVFGNPFYPADFRVGAAVVFGDGHGAYQQGGFKLGSLLANLRELYLVRLLDRGVYTPDLTNQTGWGWVFVVCGIPAMLVAVFVSRGYRWLVGAFCVSLLCLIGSVQVDVWNGRFLSWVPAIGIVAVGLAWEQLRGAARQMSYAGLCVACMALNFVSVVGSGQHEASAWASYMRMSLRERHASFMGDFAKALRHVPPGEVLGYWGRGDSWIYPLHDAHFTRDYRYVPLGPDSSVAGNMRTAGVRYLVILDWTGKVVDRILEKACAAGVVKHLGNKCYRLEEGGG